jgi:hypothetical protein
VRQERAIVAAAGLLEGKASSIEGKADSTGVRTCHAKPEEN